MNRNDRLYAIVDELRVVAPRPRSAHWLARRFSVTERTIRRDVDALQQTGVPIYAEAGRRGGYVIDRAHTLPPLNITAPEAVAAAVALNALAGTPFGSAARSALCKLLSVMARRDVEAAHDLASRVHLVAADPQAPATDRGVLRVAEQALLRRLVLTIEYADRNGVVSRRCVEPLGLLGAGPQWYLVGWCRLRGEVREFRLDRMLAAAPTAEVAPQRVLAPGAVALPNAPAARLRLPGPVHGASERHSASEWHGALERHSAPERQSAAELHSASESRENADRMLSAATVTIGEVDPVGRAAPDDRQHEPRRSVRSGARVEGG